MIKSFRLHNHFQDAEHLLLGILSVCQEGSSSGLRLSLGVNPRSRGEDETCAFFASIGLTLKNARTRTL